MIHAIRARSPQLGLAAFVAVSVATLWLDAYHARPVIQRWLETRDASPPVPSVSDPQALGFRGLHVPIETSSGELTTLAETGGRVRIATMFYAHCPTMCPLAVNAIQRINGYLTTAERSKLGVLLVSLDPARDSPSQLRDFESARHIDSKRWVLARTSQSDVSVVAQALGISYRNLSSGVVDHSPALVLLDARGRELARTQSMGVPDAAFVAAVRRAIAVDTRP